MKRAQIWIACCFLAMTLSGCEHVVSDSDLSKQVLGTWRFEDPNGGMTGGITGSLTFSEGGKLEGTVRGAPTILFGDLQIEGNWAINGGYLITEYTGGKGFLSHVSGILGGSFGKVSRERLHFQGESTMYVGDGRLERVR